MEQISDAFDDPFTVPSQTPLLWYFALRAADRFQALHGRKPGDFQGHDASRLESDTEAVWAIMQVM